MGGAIVPATQAAANKASEASSDANLARMVFVAIVGFLVFLIALSDFACRNRIRRTIEAAEAAESPWGDES